MRERERGTERDRERERERERSHCTYTISLCLLPVSSVYGGDAHKSAHISARACFNIHMYICGCVCMYTCIYHRVPVTVGGDGDLFVSSSVRPQH